MQLRIEFALLCSSNKLQKVMRLKEKYSGTGSFVYRFHNKSMIGSVEMLQI